MKMLQLIAIIANMLLALTQIVGATVMQKILCILTTKLKIARKKQKNVIGLSSATYFQKIKKQVREMIIDYTLAKECKNEEVLYTCYQCGKCGRVFENGFMIDDGGTTIEEEQE